MTIPNTQIRTVIITEGISLLPATQGLLTSKYSLARFDSFAVPGFFPVSVRGGKGTPVPRRKKEILHYYEYKTPFIIKDTISVSSDSNIIFFPAKETKTDVSYDDHKDIFYEKVIKDSALFSYRALAEFDITGDSLIEYVDFLQYIKKDDAMVLNEFLLTEDSQLWSRYNVRSYDDLKITVDDDNIIIIAEI